MFFPTVYVSKEAQVKPFQAWAAKVNVSQATRLTSRLVGLALENLQTPQDAISINKLLSEITDCIHCIFQCSVFFG